MSKIISALNGHGQFAVGFLDSRLRHFGAYNSGVLPPHGAADIATQAVQQHRADQNVFAALTAFVTDVKQQASKGPGTASANGPSHVLQTVLIILSTRERFRLCGVGRVQCSRRAFLLVSRILFAGSVQLHCRMRQSSYLTMRARIGSPDTG
jgi:hypothetical protein